MTRVEVLLEHMIAEAEVLLAGNSQWLLVPFPAELADALAAAEADAEDLEEDGTAEDEPDAEDDDVDEESDHAELNGDEGDHSGDGS